MTDIPDPELLARAQNAYERTVANDRPVPASLDEKTLAILRRAVRRLPRQTRAVFVAHYCDRRGYSEIAEATGLSVVDVERHIARAITRLHAVVTRTADDRRQPRWRAWCARYRR